jgi:hypothetical protein
MTHIIASIHSGFRENHSQGFPKPWMLKTVPATLSNHRGHALAGRHQ